MRNIEARAQVLFGKFMKIVFLLIAALILYVLFYNRAFIIYKFTPQHEVKRYGVTWRTNLAKAKQVAGENGREIMVVYINSGTNNAPSNHLIEDVFNSDEFKNMAITYIPLLVDIRKDVTPSPTEKGAMDEIIKQFDLGDNFGRVLLASANGYESRHVDVKTETVNILRDKLSDGKYVSKPPITRPVFRNPFKKRLSARKKINP